jgi:hypothetical protein
VSNPVEFTGGAEEESLDNVKYTAPLLLKSRSKFVTSGDGEALSLNYGGILIAKVNKNVYGSLSCQVVIVPSGGGYPSTALKTNLQTYLIGKTVLESMDVRVVDPTYVTCTPVMQVKVSSGFSFATIKPYITLCLKLTFSEVTKEIQENYRQNGIASAITAINSKWSYSFSNPDYTQIIKLLKNIEPTSFGKSFEDSTVKGYVDIYVSGVDHCTMSSPSFPISIDNDEISTDNVLDGNVTEIT